MRSEAMLTYLSRVVGPIWEASLTYRSKEHKFECQSSNMEMLLPALSKLKNISAALHQYRTELTRATSVQD